MSKNENSKPQLHVSKTGCAICDANRLPHCKHRAKSGGGGDAAQESQYGNKEKRLAGKSTEAGRVAQEDTLDLEHFTISTEENDVLDASRSLPNEMTLLALKPLPEIERAFNDFIATLAKKAGLTVAEFKKKHPGFKSEFQGDNKLVLTVPKEFGKQFLTSLVDQGMIKEPAALEQDKQAELEDPVQHSISPFSTRPRGPFGK